jgi:exosome complex RNA-binding protein Rrp42 (RNase PH superfamily)
MIIKTQYCYIFFLDLHVLKPDTLQTNFFDTHFYSIEIFEALEKYNILL